MYHNRRGVGGSADQQEGYDEKLHGGTSAVLTRGTVQPTRGTVQRAASESVPQQKRDLRARPALPEPGARRKESAASLKVRCRVTNIPARRGGGGRERSSATSPCASPCAAAAAFLSRILEPRVPLFAPTPCAMDASSCAASLASMAPAGRRGHSKPKRCSKALYYCVPAGARPATMNRAGNGDKRSTGEKK